MADLKALADQLVNLSVKDVKELTDILKSEYGIEPAAVAATVVAAPAANAVAVPVEQTEFDVVMKSAGQGKLNVVKEVKNILGLGLKEAKDLVDSAPPVVVKASIPKGEAESIKATLEAAGAEIEIK